MARFLVEEKDEDEPDVTTIELKLSRKINSQYIPVRLMSNFTKYPALYTSADEQKAIRKFKELLDPKAKQIISYFQSQDNAIVAFPQFSQYITSLCPKMPADTLDCAFVMLMKGRTDI